MALIDDQQFCLRWNNFQANITSQFETLRDDEDFTDVTIACEGQRLQAHKVVLSACSPFFKELFKTNPCSHPIIFMRDVEAKHIVALMEFMYAGEVNVAQTHLSTFLKTAESLKIRGLTDTSSEINQKELNETLNINHQLSKNTSTNSISSNNNNNDNSKLIKQQITSPSSASSSSTVNSSQDIATITDNSSPCSPPPAKKQCKSEMELTRLIRPIIKTDGGNAFVLQNTLETEVTNKNIVLPLKEELNDYLSEDDGRDDGISSFFPAEMTELPGGMEIIPQVSNFNPKETNQDTSTPPGSIRLRRRRSSSDWTSFDFHQQTDSESTAELQLQKTQEGDKRNRLIKLGEGIEIYEDQLRSVKWSDYRKLTRGLATILFSPAELATCSVTGQRWSRAGSGERPVKPALDRSKVQAIISYVATRFPMVEISRIKQVLAYKCKENSTAFKMKAVRYYEDQHAK